MLDYLRNLFTCRRRDNDRGASAVEYGLLVAGIAAVIVTIVFIFGNKIENIFNNTCAKVNSNTACSAPANTTTP